MTSSDKAPRKFFTTVAGDAFLITAALFALCMGALGAIMLLVPGLTGPDGPVGVLGTVLSGTSSLLGIASVAAGPVIAWRLHGRDFGGATIPGIAVGIVGAWILMAVGTFAIVGISMGIGALTGQELVGLIVALAMVVLAFLVIVVRLDVDAVRDMAPERNEHRRIDVLRLVSTGVLAVFTAGVVAAVVMNPAGEFGEAIVFTIMAGASAGLVTAIADLWVRREERKHADSGSAITA